MPINALINASFAPKVLEGLRLIKTNNLPNNRFLSTTSPFSAPLSSPGEIIKNHPTRGLTSVEVKEFIAVSTIVHCIDGWTYLNNSINAFLNGDSPIAIHLAYYAELRAAISFLASEGILIANTNQICIDSHDNLYIPGVIPGIQALAAKDKGTHNATWKIMEAWINNNTRTSNALEYFSYGGKTFKELMPSIPYAPTTPAAQLTIIKDWLKVWCFDIIKYTKDREARNMSSYNPNINRNSTPMDLTERLININNFWRTLEPSIESFSKIDLYLLSSYLTRIYDSYTSSLSGNLLDKSSYIDLFFQNSGLSNDRILTNVFVNNLSNTLINHSYDNNADPITGDSRPLSIISRAILLLRYSTGACAYLLKLSNISRQELNFYIDKIGKDWGVWDISQPVDFKNLWDDICILLEYFDEYLDLNTPSSLYTVRNELEEYTKYSYLYTQFSRAGLWGLNI